MATRKRATAATPKANKQRLTLMSRREKTAASTGGWLDERIPEDAVRTRLSNEPRTINVDPVLTILKSRVGWTRLLAAPEANHLEPNDIRQQARDTAAVLEELQVRLHYMHPNLKALVDGSLFRAHELSVLTIRERTKPDLLLLAASLRMAESTIANWPVRTGPKYKEAQGAMAAIAKALRDHSKPSYSVKDSRALAKELLGYCLG
jgi:hypothetical protein